MAPNATEGWDERVDEVPLEPAAEDEVTTSFEGSLERYEHLGTLLERVTAQTRFSAEVVSRVRADLVERRARVEVDLEERTGELEARRTELAGERAARRRDEEDTAFRREELALRRTIGELPDAEDALAEVLAEHQRSRAHAEARLGYVEALLARWRALRPEDPLPLPADPEELDPARLCLVVNEGSAGESVVPIVGDEVHIGRGGANHLVLRGDARVSRAHLAIVREGGRWHAIDRGAANPTLVNGEELVGRRRLFGGEELIVGETFLRVRLG